MKCICDGDGARILISNGSASVGPSYFGGIMSDELLDKIIGCECDAPIHLTDCVLILDPESVKVVYRCEGCGKKIAIYATINAVMDIQEVEVPRIRE